ncbi:MAG: PHP domain-containing protein [Coriobacteriia bacterium]|nr:PHP domain-containing protein [Coriobacteriia bacterium]
MPIRNLADLHTHTTASGHAYSTVAELAASAAARGLELIAVTDHGPRCPGAPHPWHFLNMKVVPSIIGGVRVLKGVEANPVPDTANGIDLDDEMLSKLDFVAVGFHPETGYDDTGKDWRTEALLRVIANPLVDMITHPGNPSFPVHCESIVAACVEHGVIVELNNGSFEPSMARSRETGQEHAFARAAVDAGAYVAITSDAHFHAHVGRFDRALAVAEQLGLREDRLVSRDAATVLAHLTARRERPRLEWGGVI